jgi:hypothetical protein
MRTTLNIHPNIFSLSRFDGLDAAGEHVHVLEVKSLFLNQQDPVEALIIRFELHGDRRYERV